jgi:hypothetical protein
MIHTLDDCRTIELRRIPDARGNLTPVEAHTHAPFAICRARWIREAPAAPAYRDVHELIIAVSGRLEVRLDDGRRRRVETLSRADAGLYVPSTVWREPASFSADAVCLVLTSAPVA